MKLTTTPLTLHNKSCVYKEQPVGSHKPKVSQVKTLEKGVYRSCNYPATEAETEKNKNETYYRSERNLFLTI